MQQLIILGFVGLIAQLIDGSMGMGYGATSSSLLLAAGFAPVSVAASVHAAKVVTATISGTAHWRLGNVDRGIVLKLALPGALGAVLGALFLSSIPAEAARLFFASILFVLGCSVIYRYRRRNASLPDPHGRPIGGRLLAPLGLVGGFVDASGGGGWGPITTSTLLAHPSARPRKVIGSVNTAEFAVALSATTTFWFALGLDAIRPEWFVALLAGGVVAAPFAAWLVRYLPGRQLGLLVGGMILLTNGRTLAVLAGADATVSAIAFLVLFLVWTVFVFRVIAAFRRERRRVAAIAIHSDEVPFGT